MYIRAIYAVRDPFDMIHLFEKAGRQIEDDEFVDLCESIALSTYTFGEFVEALGKKGFREISPGELNGYFDFNDLSYL